jgi:biotin-(acetyl-CoA carboxylase) ligase
VLLVRGEGGTVVGLGVNVFGAGEELAPGCAAATLEEAGARVASREELLGRVLSRLAEGYALAREGRTAELLQAAAEADALAGRWVTVAIREGELSGLAAGLDERCRLRLRTEAGEMVLAEGEVTQVAG